MTLLPWTRVPGLRSSSEYFTIGVQVKASQPAAPKISVTKQPAVAASRMSNPQESEPRTGSDLFGAQSEQRAAPLPAFLSTQDRSAEEEEDDRFEIPAFLRRQAGSGN